MNKTYEELCSMKIGDMNKEELYNFALGLLEEVWKYEKQINKAIEYIETDIEYNGIAMVTVKTYDKLLNILKGEENE